MTERTRFEPHTHVALARQGYHAFARSDGGALLELLSPDVVWHVGGSGPLSGAHRGHDGVGALLSQVFALTAGSQQLEVFDIFANDDFAVSVIHERATRARDGATLDVREAHVMRIDQHGRVAEFWDLPDDSAAHDAFFA